MAKIIDTHSHILPGIDDGAGSWKEALCMLKTAQAQGIRRVIATPHWGGPFGYTDPGADQRTLFYITGKSKTSQYQCENLSGAGSDVHRGSGGQDCKRRDPYIGGQPVCTG